MFNTAEYSDVSITKEYILTQISEADIFYKYLGLTPKLRQKFCNPYRDDSNPTCCFYISESGVLRFKDFTGWCNWSCFDAVMYIERLPFNHAILKIALDFGLVKDGKVKNVQRVEPTNLTVEKESFSPKLQITSKDFTPLELEWWRSFGIRPSTLNLYNVKSVSHVWLNGRVLLTSTPNKPSYAYCFDRGKYKVYSPNNCEFKWVSSCKQDSYQGYDQLNWVGDLLIITKSLKDVMVLREMGYDSIAPHSEHCNIPWSFVESLKKRFKRVVVMFDNDEAGIKGASKLCQELGLQSIIIPDNLSKDISDYVKSNNLQKGKVLMEKILG